MSRAGWWWLALCVLAVAGATALFLEALGLEKARQEAWWAEMKPHCRLLTVVTKTFGPPQAIYECPGGVLVKRNIGD